MWLGLGWWSGEGLEDGAGVRVPHNRRGKIGGEDRV